MQGPGVSGVPGFDDWSYGEFRHDHDAHAITVPLIRRDGRSYEFTVPQFVDDPEDLRTIAGVVIGANEKWNAVQGLGA